MKIPLSRPLRELSNDVKIDMLTTKISKR